MLGGGPKDGLHVRGRRRGGRDLGCGSPGRRLEEYLPEVARQTPLTSRGRFDRE
jgi:hypothetical protein